VRFGNEEKGIVVRVVCVKEEENALFPTTSFTLIIRISQQSVFIYNNKTKDFTTSVKCCLSLSLSLSFSAAAKNYHSKSAAGLSPSSEDESSWNKSLSRK
jgi:hypothetical protein